MKVLVLNAGSSSVKFNLFAMTTETVLAKGQVERIGLKEPKLIYKRTADGATLEKVVPEVKNHVDAIQAICDALIDPTVGSVKSLREIQAVGHRVLMGGDKITRPCRVDNAVKAIIREYIPLGPLHNPANLAGIEACEAAMPGVPNVAVFDTEFHQTMPPESYLYAIPYEFYEKHGIRKYGFHGTSHRYVTLATAKFLGKPVDETTLITCHLGNGCSMAAIKNGKVYDTTMGLTPLEGLMMGTRSGNIDAAAVLKMLDLGNSAADVDRILNKQSGLLGVGGINSGDMRDMLAAAERGEGRAELAIRMFVVRVIRYIGAYYVILGGTDAIVFTGGVGEYSLPVRKLIVDGVRALGVKLDDARNNEFRGKPGIISTDDSAFKVIVMPTNEELMIARNAVEVLS